MTQVTHGDWEGFLDAFSYAFGHGGYKLDEVVLQVVSWFMDYGDCAEESGAAYGLWHDGRWFAVTCDCDTTGYYCQGSFDIEFGATKEEAVNNCFNDSEKKRLELG